MLHAQMTTSLVTTCTCSNFSKAGVLLEGLYHDILKSHSLVLVVRTPDIFAGAQMILQVLNVDTGSLNMLLKVNMDYNLP